MSLKTYAHRKTDVILSEVSTVPIVPIFEHVVNPFFTSNYTGEIIGIKKLTKKKTETSTPI